MPNAYDLTQLDANSFEQMVNALAINVLGSGHAGFGPGPDGGRDGYFEGSAPYPSSTNNWSGVWFIQSKFHKPHLSKDPQKWLIEQIKKEIKDYSDKKKRKWPDNWIVATNIEPSGCPDTGAFDEARRVVKQANPELAEKFHIWGGGKIIDFLTSNPLVATQYGHFLTPGNVLTALYEAVQDDRVTVKDIIRFLVIREFDAHQFTKLDQAGSEADTRPGVHSLFVDLPFKDPEHSVEGLLAEHLILTSSKNHRPQCTPVDSKWLKWRALPSQARVWFIQGGPGQGKSTSGQYFSQLQRAALILNWEGDPIHQKYRPIAEDIKETAMARNHWPSVPRIPINIELRDYAHWFGLQEEDTSRGILPYMAQRIQGYVDKPVSPSSLKRALRSQQWFVVFDGLDEVPNDVKDSVALKIKDFINDITIECDCDVHFVCTSRPQGYSGQFNDIGCTIIKLCELSPDKAFECAEPVIRIGRSDTEADRGIALLKAAISSPAVKSLMTTPLQSHIMAVVVRDGKRPPERRWQLFENFYQVIKRREANRDLPDKRIAQLLRQEEQLLRSIHSRLGFILHSKAETSKGALTNLTRAEFKELATDAVTEMKSDSTSDTIEALMEATAIRLVLVNTPDDGNSLRFDIRQLQEFFASELLHDALELNEFRERITLIAGDAHWREVVHFVISAMIELRRVNEVSIIVQILESLNDGGGEEAIRSVHRRLARGALLTATILQDGVLEQDKRVRAKFKKCIEPLAGSVDISDLSLLFNIEHTDSKNWLIMCFMERLREADCSESVGAAVLLLKLLSENDSHIEEYIALFSSKPDLYRAEVYRIWVEPLPEDEKYKVPCWIIKLILAELIHSKWCRLGSVVAELIPILFAGKDHIIDQLNFIGVPEHYAQLLPLLSYGASRRSTDELDTPKGKLIEDYGIISEHEGNIEWKLGKFEDPELDKLIIENPSQDLGVFTVAANLHVFIKERSFLSFRRMLLSFEGCIDQLPGNLKTYMPFDVKDYSELLHKTESEENFNNWIKSTPGRSSWHFSNESVVPTEGQWLRLIEVQPNLAVAILIGVIPVGSETIYKKSKFIRPFIARIIQNPDVLAYLPFLQWGMLLEHSDEKITLRQKFVEWSSLNGLVETNGWIIHRGGTSSFVIDLESEIILVPRLLDAAILKFEVTKKLINEQSAVRDLVSDAGSLIKEFIPLARSVRQINQEHHTLEEAFILILRLFHPDIREDLRLHFKFILETLRSNPDVMLLRMVITYIRVRLAESEPDVLLFVSELLDVCRSDFKLRREFYPLLRTWRETSLFPTTKGNVLNTWLTPS